MVYLGPHVFLESEGGWFRGKLCRFERGWPGRFDPRAPLNRTTQGDTQGHLAEGFAHEEQRIFRLQEEDCNWEPPSLFFFFLHVFYIQIRSGWRVSKHDFLGAWTTWVLGVDVYPDDSDEVKFEHQSIHDTI